MFQATQAVERISEYVQRYARATGYLKPGAGRGVFYKRVDPKYERTLLMVHGQLIAFEGPPGAGKTTAMRSTAAALRAAGATVTEHPEERHDFMLNDFFSNPSVKGFQFQMFKLSQRQLKCEQLMRQHAALSYDGYVTYDATHLLDRTLPGDMAFAFWNYAMGYFSDAQLDEYMLRAAEHDYPKPCLVLYLSADPDTLVKRILIRGNKDEIALYTRDYFIIMDRCYREALAISGCSYCVVPWDENDEGVGVSADASVKPHVPFERCMKLIESAITSVYGDNVDRLIASKGSPDRTENDGHHLPTLAGIAVVHPPEGTPESMFGADPTKLANTVRENLRSSVDSLRANMDSTPSEENIIKPGPERVRLIPMSTNYDIDPDPIQMAKKQYWNFRDPLQGIFTDDDSDMPELIDAPYV